MIAWFSTFPAWFWMIVIAVVVGGLMFRLVVYGIKIKAGKIEIDASAENTAENKEEVKEAGSEGN